VVEEKKLICMRLHAQKHAACKKAAKKVEEEMKMCMYRTWRYATARRRWNAHTTVVHMCFSIAISSDSKCNAMVRMMMVIQQKQIEELIGTDEERGIMLKI